MATKPEKQWGKSSVKVQTRDLAGVEEGEKAIERAGGLGGIGASVHT